jgi:hypothetical protein
VICNGELLPIKDHEVRQECGIECGRLGELHLLKGRGPTIPPRTLDPTHASEQRMPNKERLLTS